MNDYVDLDERSDWPARVRVAATWIFALVGSLGLCLWDRSIPREEGANIGLPFLALLFAGLSLNFGFRAKETAVEPRTRKLAVAGIVAGFLSFPGLILCLVLVPLSE